MVFNEAPIRDMDSFPDLTQRTMVVGSMHAYHETHMKIDQEVNICAIDDDDSAIVPEQPHPRQGDCARCRVCLVPFWTRSEQITQGPNRCIQIL